MLKEINMRPLTARELKPEGWLRQQLEIQDVYKRQAWVSDCGWR